MEWLTNWNRRKLITVNGTTAGAQSDYQMKLTVNQAGGTDSVGIVNLGGNVQTTFNDLRFTKSDGSTLLNCWIESITGTTSNQTATVWIKLAPSLDTIPISPGTYSFYIYYDNPSAAAASDGTNTFISFLDFENTIEGFDGGNSVTTQKKFGSYSFDLAIANRHKSITMPTKPFVLMMWMRPSGTSQNSTLQFENVYNTNGAYIGTSYGYAGKWVYYEGVWKDTGIAFSATWFKIELVCNTSAYDIKIDDVTVKTGVAYTSAAAVNGYQLSSNAAFYIDGLTQRKYASPEPTFSTAGTEELGITAYSMSLHPSETPCRTGICTVRTDVVWQNLGNSSITFRPKILIDGITYVQAALDITIGAYTTSSLIQITTPTLSAGSHQICPYPN